MDRRTLRLVVTVYLVKTLLVAGVWLVAPETSRSLVARLRAAWSEAIGSPPRGAEAPDLSR